MKTILLTFRSRATRAYVEAVHDFLPRLGSVGTLNAHRPWSFTFSWEAERNGSFPFWFILMWNVTVEDVQS